jgi:hypothetical protein
MPSVYYNRHSSLAFARQLDPDGQAPLTNAEFQKLKPGEKAAVTRALNALSTRTRNKVAPQSNSTNGKSSGASSSSRSSGSGYRSSITKYPHSGLAQYAGAQGLDPKLWTVMVNSNRFVQFSSERAADADIKQHNAGTKFAPGRSTRSSSSSSSSKRPPLPWSSTGWVRVSDGRRTWQFDRRHEAAARRCINSFGGSATVVAWESRPQNPIPSSWRHGFNPPGPTYQ